MLILMAIGLFATLVTLVYLGVVAYRLYKTVLAMQQSVQQPMQEIIDRQATAMATMERIQLRQLELEKNLAALSQSSQQLNYLRSEFSDAVGALVGRKI